MTSIAQSKLIDECKQIQQNALYTAQSHHDRAEFFQKASFVLRVLPALGAAISGALVGVGSGPDELVWLAVLGAAISAVTGVLNPDREAEDHTRAAKAFTSLRHDARFLHEVQVHVMGNEHFIAAVERIHARYNDVVGMSPSTGRSFFEKARKFIQLGRHEPDKNSDGSIR
jgi:hypothetical protein